MQHLKVVCAWSAVVVLLGCGSSKTLRLQGQLGLSACSSEGLMGSTSEWPAPFNLDAFSPLLRERLPERTLMVAHASGLTGPLEELVAMRGSHDGGGGLEQRLRRMELRSLIQHKLNTTALEVSAAAAEMDCEEERADQIANYLSAKEAKAETRLTVAAIVVGALGGIGSGVLLTSDRDDNTAEFVGVATGVIEVALGTAILLNRKRVSYMHERNVLREVWEGTPRSEILPPSVWSYLGHRVNGEPSLREQLVAKWSGFGQVEVGDREQRKRSAAEALYYGDGGIYAADELANRANMYDQLESHINLMHQDILLLSRFAEELR